MTIDGPSNPGLPGRMVFAREGRVYEVLVERGSVAPLADGTMPYAAPNGELAYMNAAGQIAVVTPDGSAIAYAAWDAVKNYRVVVRARSGREIVSLPGYTAPNFYPRWSADRRRLSQGGRPVGRVYLRRRLPWVTAARP